MDGSIRKSLGIVAGAPDTFLFVPKGIFHGLAVEFKTPTGRQSESQKLFQERLERMTYRYEIVRSLDDFITVINSYLSITYLLSSGECYDQSPVIAFIIF